MDAPFRKCQRCGASYQYDHNAAECCDVFRRTIDALQSERDRLAGEVEAIESALAMADVDERDPQTGELFSVSRQVENIIGATQSICRAWVQDKNELAALQQRVKGLEELLKMFNLPVAARYHGPTEYGVFDSCNQWMPLQNIAAAINAFAAPAPVSVKCNQCGRDKILGDGGLCLECFQEQPAPESGSAGEAAG
jgi:hypothetical protein